MPEPLILVNVHLDRAHETPVLRLKFHPAVGAINGYEVGIPHGEEIDPVIGHLQDLIEGLKSLRKYHELGQEPRGVMTTEGRRILPPETQS